VTAAPDDTGTALAPAPATPYAIEAETSASAVAAREKAAVEARFLVAINRPRDFDTARLRILSAVRRPRFAKEVRYEKPIGGARVTGLSIRFAEEAARLWGNLDVQAILTFDNREKRIYRVWATDLETNTTSLAQDVIVEKVVERRQPRTGQVVIGKRENSKGETVYLIEADEDAMLVKCNALISKVRRNAILALLPADLKEEAEEVAITTLKDRDAKDPEGARNEILASFWSLGVTPEQVRTIVEGKPLETINPAELTLLRSVYTALREGEATWADVEVAFRKKENGTNGKDEAPARSAPARILSALDKKRRAADPPPPNPDLDLDKKLAKEEDA